MESWLRRDIPHPPRPPLGPTPPPIQWVPGLTRGVKWPGCGVEHPPPSSAKVKERVELYLCSTSGPSWPVIGYSLPLLQRNILGRSSNVYTSSAVVLVFMVI